MNSGGLGEMSKLASQEKGRYYRVLLLSALLLLGFGPAQSNAAGLAALEKAAALVQQGKLTEADHEAQIALSAQETRAAANSVLGHESAASADRPRDAVGYLKEAIRLNPRLMGAHPSISRRPTC